MPHPAAVRFARLALALPVLVSFTFAAEPKEGQSPVDHLPSHIKRLTSFGERPDWSADGKKILFLSKTFGDAMEYDLATGAITNRTAHFPHHGIVRALYLVNGDILLTMPTAFDPKNAGRARRECYLYLLDKSSKKPAVPLGVLCNEGPAVSRHRLHIGWTEWTDPKAGENLSGSTMFEGDIVYTDGVPTLANRTLILAGTDLGFRATMEVQNFRPPEEKELTFSAYSGGGQKCDVMIIDLATKKFTNLTNSPDLYDEPEGIYPDGKHTLVEHDGAHPGGINRIDLWRLSLDGKGEYVRLTHFGDYPGYKCSNPVVSDDGKFIAFQMGRSGEAAGVGHGIFVYELNGAQTGAK
jgi:hypothetical protein